MSSDSVWYLYQNNQQVGPFDTQQITQLLTNKMISQDSFIFKAGWKDWRVLSAGYEDLGLDIPEDFTEKPSDKRANAPRAGVSGRVVVHSGDQASFGKGVNISTTGLFVETSEQLFSVGQRLKISVRCDGLDKAFNAEAQVVRYNSDPGHPVGYGFQFTNIEAANVASIQTLVDAENEKLKQQA
jgi:hypothetical protein